MLKKLHLVSTPIGDITEITHKAVETLKASDAIIVEEYKVAKKLLDMLKIDFSKKEIYELNEHNERKGGNELFEKIVFKHKFVSMISDAGTPAVADPGQTIIQNALAFKIEVKHVGGTSSIIAALQVSGLPTDDFYYAGFVPRVDKQREYALQKLTSLKTTIILLETPYRLGALLESMKKVFPTGIPVAICFNLTETDEYIFRGRLDEAVKKYANENKKERFVFLLNNRQEQKR